MIDNRSIKDIKREFTKACKDNGMFKDHVLKNFMVDYINKNGFKEIIRKSSYNVDDYESIQEIKNSTLATKDKNKLYKAYILKVEKM